MALAWIVLVVSGILETVWASALARSAGFSRLVPSLVFGVALVLSMAGLAYALRTIPVGTGYAIWVGIGAVGTAAYGMAVLGEPVTTARLLCLVLIVGGVLGLKFLHEPLVHGDDGRVTVARLLVALACVAVPGWVLTTRWSAVLAGHPAYPVLLGVLVVSGVVLLVRRRAPLLVGVLLLVLVGGTAWLRPFPADPVPQVEAVETLTTWELRPAGASTGLVFVPGARVDPRAYLALLAPVADAGHVVVVPKPPLGIALLDPGAAARAFDAHPDVRRWVVGGHSLGGTAAAAASEDPRVGGLLLWASYPAGDLSTSTLDVLSVSGDRDGLATPADIARTRPLLPPDARFVTVPGGVHAFFGDYGEQPGDGVPGVDRAVAQRRIVEATVAFVGSAT